MSCPTLVYKLEPKFRELYEKSIKDKREYGMIIYEDGTFDMCIGEACEVAMPLKSLKKGFGSFHTHPWIPGLDTPDSLVPSLSDVFTSLEYDEKFSCIGHRDGILCYCPPEDIEKRRRLLAEYTETEDKIEKAAEAIAKMLNLGIVTEDGADELADIASKRVLGDRIKILKKYSKCYCEL